VSCQQQTAAVAVLVRPSRRGPETLLGRRDDDGLLCWPGGRIEWGEGCIRAARRELHEETGYRLSSPPSTELWGGFNLSSPDWWVYVGLWRESRFGSRLRRLRPQSGETTWVGWVSVAHLAEEGLHFYHRPVLALLRKTLDAGADIRWYPRQQEAGPWTT
jgi:8-oxo-dGTP pyrophosphatase MutT (NUDIX family)